MKTHRSLTGAAVVLVLFGQWLAPSAHAELPELESKEWMGAFAGYADSKIRISVSTTGEIVIKPVYKGKEARAYVRMPVTWGLEMTMPNGRKVIQEVIPESVTSDDKTNAEFETTTLRGKFEGYAEAEVVIEQKRGVLSIGGRITNPGTYKPESIRFHVKAQVLNFYGAKFQELKNNPDAFEALVSADSLELKRTDKKRLKFEFIEVIDLSTEEVSGPGVAEAEVSIKSVDRTFNFEATENSAMTLSNRRNGALHQGMNINWSPVPDKDPKATARLVITVK